MKEDLGLTVAVLGAIIALTMDRRIGVALAGWGVAWFVLATTVILPAFNREARWDYASKLDAGGALADPLGTVAGLFVAPKLETVAFLILAGALIALRSPLLLLVVPTLAWRFLSPTEAYWAPGYHYDAVLMPIVFAAAIDGIVRARRGRQHWLAMASRATVPVLAVAAIALFSRSPMVDLTQPAIWQPAPRAAQAQAALDQVPAGASVLSDIGLMSYLVDDHEVFWLGNPGYPAPQYGGRDSLGGGLGQGALNRGPVRRGDAGGHDVRDRLRRRRVPGGAAHPVGRTGPAARIRSAGRTRRTRGGRALPRAARPPRARAPRGALPISSGSPP